MKLTDQQKKEARDEIRMLEGLPPHNTPSNICFGDGYFAKSLIHKYGMSIRELKTAVDMR